MAVGFIVALHIPPLQPDAHAVSTAAYAQAPAAHVPGEENVRSMLAERHSGAGGASHATGVPAQTPLTHESTVVHAFSSSHDAPSACVLAQGVPGLPPA